MDENDSQFAQSLPIDFIQLLQCVQSGAPIPLNTQRHINNNNILMFLLSCVEGTRQQTGKCHETVSTLTYFIARGI